MSSFRSINQILKGIDVRQCSDLIWFKQSQIGWLPISDEESYSDEYYDHFFGYRNTPMGKDINDFRVEIVNKYCKDMVIDIGIGSGHFIDQRGHKNTRGYDVSSRCRKWLTDRQLLCDPPLFSNALSFWDSLEHIRDFLPMIESVREWVFISIPIFKDSDDILSSRHYKPHEHWWYFTDESIQATFRELGFVMREKSGIEVQCGRVGVVTYVFQRIIL
tara:strand:+ start:990 stop:1643 length:654 start_codon:yes stop_codon:yes gene_type:complete